MRWSNRAGPCDRARKGMEAAPRASNPPAVTQLLTRDDAAAAASSLASLWHCAVRTDSYRAGVIEKAYAKF